MRLVGWCVRCRRIRNVKVTGPWNGKTAVGICLDCERAERDEDDRRRGLR